jgi:tetratricopeptide (TPR) repeat protein
MQPRWIAGLALLIATAGRADPMEPDDLPDPRPEIATNEPSVALPAVPGFELPPAEPGVHGPRELRVHGRALLGREIKTRGYVTSIYDCAAALAEANPQAPRAQVALSIRRDPALCARLWFYLGDAAGALREASIWVVDVPRRPAGFEREAVSNEDYVRYLAQPRIAPGDHVIVTGQWTTRSPHNDHASHGLLVYRALEHAPPIAATGPSPPPTATPAPGEAEVAVVTRPPLRKLVPVPVFNASVDHLNACNRQIAAGHPDAGIAECQAALAIWNGNHLAWYEIASAHIARGAWAEARAAAEHAVTARPDRAMYQLYHGIALYEAEHDRAQRDRAQREHRPPDEVEVDPSELALDAARDALVRATRLGPRLWRAHYYLGRVYRDLDDARRAAEQFTQAIAAHPTYRAGYVALCELYRSWDYVDQALAVAKLGTTVLPGEAELWSELGMAQAARRADEAAIAAFDRALALRPQDVAARFQRGQVHARRGDVASARSDLEAVVASSARSAQMSEIRPIALEILSRLRR